MDAVFTEDGLFKVCGDGGWVQSRFNGVIIGYPESTVASGWFFRLVYPDDGEPMAQAGCRVSHMYWSCKLADEYVELGWPRWMYPARIPDHS